MDSFGKALRPLYSYMCSESSYLFLSARPINCGVISKLKKTISKSIGEITVPSAISPSQKYHAT